MLFRSWGICRLEGVPLNLHLHKKSLTLLPQVRLDVFGLLVLRTILYGVLTHLAICVNFL